MNKKLNIITLALISGVWLINGLYCKVLGLVPRHELIVARILGQEYAWLFTKAIGVAEILMVIWIVSRIKSRSCSIFQMLIVGTMNIIELLLAPDLLLFGRMNIVFAFLFVVIIYINEFVLGKHNQHAIKSN